MNTKKTLTVREILSPASLITKNKEDYTYDKFEKLAISSEEVEEALTENFCDHVSHDENYETSKEFVEHREFYIREYYVLIVEHKDEIADSKNGYIFQQSSFDEKEYNPDTSNHITLNEHFGVI